MTKRVEAVCLPAGAGDDLARGRQIHVVVGDLEPCRQSVVMVHAVSLHPFGRWAAAVHQRSALR